MARFGEESFWESKMARDRHECGIWKSIMAGNEGFWKFIRFRIGSSEKISF